jgi:hypothetical protein
VENLALPHRRLDELVLEVLAGYQLPPAPAARPSDHSIEIVFSDEECDVAVTTQFVRESLPYERVDLDLEPAPATPARRRPTTFVRTIPARATVRDMPAQTAPDDLNAAETLRGIPAQTLIGMPAQTVAPASPAPAELAVAETAGFDRVWFDRSEDSLAQLEAVAPRARRARSWLWLAISITAAAVATGALLY